MGDFQGPDVLEGYILEADLARQLKRSTRTLQRLAATRQGPPRLKIGRLIVYNVESVRAWLSQQVQPRKPPVPAFHLSTRSRPPVPALAASGRNLKRA